MVKPASYMKTRLDKDCAAELQWNMYSRLELLQGIVHSDATCKSLGYIHVWYIHEFGKYAD